MAIRKRKRAKQPNRRVELHENRRRDVTATFGLSTFAPRRQKRVPAPRVEVTPAEPISRSEVSERLMRAMKTLRAQPDRERTWFVIRNSMPLYVQQFTAYNAAPELEPRFIPTPHDVSDYLDALAWTRHLQFADWKILWLRSFELSFGLIGDYIGRSDETARRRFESIITSAWAAANNIAA